MLERSIESIVSAAIVSFLFLLIEYKSGLFIRGSPDQKSVPRLSNKILSAEKALPILSLCILIILVFISNFAFLKIISPRFINTVVIIASSIITIVLFTKRIAGRFPFLQSPIKADWKIIWISPLLLVFTIVCVKFSPRFLIVVLPISNSDQASTEIIQQIENYLDQVKQNQVVVRAIPCIGSCPSPSKLFSDSRVLLVISGDVNKDIELEPTLELTISTNCRRDPSPIDRKYAEKPECSYLREFPYSSKNDANYLKAFLPIMLLNSISNTGISGDELIKLVNQSIASLDSILLINNDELVWALHEDFFYDLLYNIPNLSQKERLDSAGEVRARVARLPNINDRVTYITARWYEESGIIDRDNLERAIAKYQEIVRNQPDNAFILSELSDVSENLYRYADAICYISEALKTEPSNEEWLLSLASLLERFGVPVLPISVIPGDTAVSPKEIRQFIQDNVVDRSDASSISEFFSLAEISLRNRNYEDALEYTDKVLASSNLTPAEEAGAYYLQGRIRIAQSNFDEGIKSFQRFIALVSQEHFNSENLIVGFTSLGHVYHGRGYHDKSAEAYEQALEFATKPEQRAAILADLAEEMSSIGKIDDAIAYFDEAINEFEQIKMETYPISLQIDYVEMLYEYALIMQNQTNQINSLEHVANFFAILINDIKQKASTDFEGCEWITKNLYLGNEQPYVYLNNYSIEPSIPNEYYHFRRASNYELGRSDEALQDTLAEIDQLERAAQTAIDYYNLCSAYYKIEDYKAAIDACQQAIDLDNPGVLEDIADATDYYIQGISYTKLMSYTQAVDVLTKASALQSKADPIQSALYYRGLANTFRQWAIQTGDQNKFQSAIAANESALELPVSDDIKAESWYSIGLIYYDWSDLDVSRYSDAIVSWRKAIALDNPQETAVNADPEDAIEWRMIGNAYRLWGEATGDVNKLQSALYAYQNAIKLYGPEKANNQAGVWYLIGLTYLELSNYNKSYLLAAVDAWRTAIDLDDPQDAGDWAMIGNAYRLWGKATKDVNKFQSAIDAYENAINLNAPDETNTQAAYWFFIGLTNLEWSETDVSRYSDAISAWEEAVRIDNPDDTRKNRDLRDIADWYMIAVTYQRWAEVDPTMLDKAVANLGKALAIPVKPNEHGYSWHEDARQLLDEINSYKP